MNINTKDLKSIQPFISKLSIPSEDSHKGQNGKVLIIGGSTLFHSASLWAAEVASHMVDMVHYASTEENNEIFLSLKKSFRNGIIVHQNDIPDYVKEDDAILIGPGMVRGESDESQFTHDITTQLLQDFPDKKFVLDAGALQMMDPEWLKNLNTPAIITPHQLEFQRIFGIDVSALSLEEKIQVVKEKARDYQCVILLKAITDIVSDGIDTVTISGGNQGLTKGGTGDVLAGLVVSLYAQNDPLLSAVLASSVEKMAAEVLFETKGIWYNTADLIDSIPSILKKLIYN